MDERPTVINWSKGTSSEWMIRAIEHGILKRPRHLAVAVAHTHLEHEWSEERVVVVRELCARLGIPILDSTQDGQTLEESLLAIPRMDDGSRIDQPPLWLATPGGRGRAAHRCTRHYKVAPMRRTVTAWLASIGAPKIIRAGDEQTPSVTRWIGFGADESHRAHKAIAKMDVGWERLDFPAIRTGRTRAQQRAEVQRWAGSTARFSMCICCPFKSERRWRETSKADLARALAIDEAVRDCTPIGLDYPAYLHQSLIPVATLLRRGAPQQVLPGLDSYCDGGACFL